MTLTQVQLDSLNGVNSLTPDQSATVLGHSTGMLGTVLSTGGAIAGGIGGAALGALAGGAAGIETGPGAIGTAAYGGYAGGVLGAGAGASAGEALAEKIGGQPIDTKKVADTGLGFGTLEAVGGPLFSGAGKLLKGFGESAAKFFIPTSAKEAVQMQSYKASNPLWQRVLGTMTGTGKDAPTTAAGTAFNKGLMGSESGIGIRAKRAASSLWRDVINPALKQSTVKQDMPEFFNEAEKSIVSNNKELGDRNSRLDALNAIKDEYKANPTATMEELQGYKEGWASHVPEKAYKGKDITQTYNNVRNELAALARQKIYDAVGDEAKDAYFDYGNLKALQQLGQTAMTGGKFKGGFGNFFNGIKEMATVPVGTIGGQTVYKVGQGVEMLGKPGARSVRDLIYGYASSGSDQGDQTSN